MQVIELYISKSIPCVQVIKLTLLPEYLHLYTVLNNLIYTIYTRQIIYN